MTVIELGQVTSGSERPPSANAPAEFDARAVRRIVLILVAVLTVLTVTGSVRPEPRMLRDLWSIPYSPDDQFTATSDSLYTITGGERLTAYDVADGTLRWSMRSAEPIGWLTQTGPAGVLLMPAGRVTQQFNSDDGGSYLTEFYRQTVALDARTGAEVWRAPGEINITTGDFALLVDRDDRGDRLRAFRLVRLRDGAVVWARSAENAVQMVTAGPDPANPRFLATVTASGEAQVLRLSDGARLVSGHIGFRAGTPGRGEFIDVFADSRNLYVRSATGAGDSLTAYELGTLRRAWQVRAVARVSAYACGPVVCTFQPTSVEAFDPATGRTRWRAPGVRNAWPISPGWLVAGDGTLTGYDLIEVATGRRIAGIGTGSPVQDADGNTYVLSGTSSPANRTAVSRVDLATGEIALRGTIDRIGENGCSATAGRLFCAAVNGRLVVADVG